MNVCGLTKEEEKIFRKLNSPRKIQDFLNKIPINFEPEGDTCISPRRVLRENRAHCIEGAILAAAALWIHGKKPLLVDLKTTKDDFEHVICVFKKNDFWGAFAKTNHAVLRYREPVYKSVRELAMSYFHEYFKDDGKKTLRSYSLPVNLKRFGTEWITSEDNLWHIHDALDKVKHFNILNKKQARNLRRADLVEIEAGKIVDFKNSG